MESPFWRAVIVTIVLVAVGIGLNALVPMSVGAKKFLWFLGGAIIFIVWLIWLFGLLGINL